ncbi:MAG: hypothetical protein C4576_21605 [Desulfobacteraceae bacterium]|nr:MAG: hypothetical protein C4576_21605 [Desulfobacteraceae bacterium]
MRIRLRKILIAIDLEEMDRSEESRHYTTPLCEGQNRNGEKSEIIGSAKKTHRNGGMMGYSNIDNPVKSPEGLVVPWFTAGT